jgi:hypothetical protein
MKKGLIFLWIVFSMAESQAQQWDISRSIFPLSASEAKGLMRADTSSQLFYPLTPGMDERPLLDNKKWYSIPQWTLGGGVEHDIQGNHWKPSYAGLAQWNGGFQSKRWAMEVGLFGMQGVGLPRERAIAGDGSSLMGWGKVHLRKDGSIDAWDYTTKVAFKINQYLTLEGGKGKLFMGEGYRSQFISQNAATFPYAKMAMRLGPFRFVSHWAQLKDNGLGWDHLRTKYFAMHSLSMDVKKKWNFALHEMVIWQRNDSTSVRNVDLHYLNPLAFWRPIEYAQGSADNVLLGASMSYTEKQRFKFYGQFLLDEWLLSEVKARNGWWGLKYGGQLGVKMMNIVPGLHALLEVNATRPFTYSHASTLQAWGQNGQPLAHPLGANYAEALMVLEYTGKNGGAWQYEFAFNRHGANQNGDNYGGDIFTSYMKPVHVYGNDLFQGRDTRTGYQRLTYARKINDRGWEWFGQGTYSWNTTTPGWNAMSVMLGIRTNGYIIQPWDF